AAPWRTIQKAANTLNGGDTVIVNAGTYNERVQVLTPGSAGKLLNFQAQGSVVMQGFNIQTDYVRVNGFEITNTPGSSPTDRTNGSGVYISGNHNEISDNYIHHSTAAGIFLTSSASNTTISGNRVAYAVECGLYISGNSNLIASNDISNNVFISRSTGYNPDVIAGSGGTVTNVTIANNTMAAVNGPAEKAVWLYPNIKGAIVKNNALYDHGISSVPYIQVDSGASGVDIGFNSVSKSDNQAPKGSAYPGDLWMVNPL